jgi:hypothetical protein
MIRRSVLALILLLFGSVSLAQSKIELAEKLADNMHSLRDYQWTMRIQVREGGTTKYTFLESVEYDSEGNLVRDLVEGEDPQERKKGIFNYQQQLHSRQELLRSLIERTIAYGHASPETWKKLVLTSLAIPEPDGIIDNIENTGFLARSDAVRLGLQNQLPKLVGIKTSHAGAPLDLRIEFKRIEGGGPAYPRQIASRYVAQEMYSERQLSVVVENFDFLKQDREKDSN